MVHCMEDPTITCIQEHNNKKDKWLAWPATKGRKLVIVSPGEQNDDKIGRPKGGLAIWAKESFTLNHMATEVKNTAYIQVVDFTPIRNGEEKYSKIRIINGYCRDVWGIKRRRAWVKEINRLRREEDGEECLIVVAADWNMEMKEQKDSSRQKRRRDNQIRKELGKEEWISLKEEWAPEELTFQPWDGFGGGVKY